MKEEIETKKERRLKRERLKKHLKELNQFKPTFGFCNDLQCTLRGNDGLCDGIFQIARGENCEKDCDTIHTFNHHFSQLNANPPNLAPIGL